jgi:hypothetical protein
VLDNYLESVRSIEKQMVALEAKTGTCTAPKLGADPTLPGAAKPYWLQNDNVGAVIKLHSELIAATFACDLTRVITLTVAGSGGAYRNHNWIPEAPRGVDWHGVSHQVEKGQDLGLTAIEKWYSGQLAVLLDAMKAFNEPGGTLLSSSLVMTMNEYGSNGAVQYLPAGSDGKRDNFTHQTKLMPILLFGQLAGALKTGRWLAVPFNNNSDARYANGRQLNQLFVSVLNAFGVPDQNFGDPTAAPGPLPGLLG